ncbi:DJ-1/PfpI family protein [Streptomyces wedmorensis]|uniref:DJ-1/PfpI family protein n=1 Tax=Streptomyces wedmorensis TaxID=43759 RepID=UPI00344079DF
MTRVGVLTYAGVDELDLAGVCSPLFKAARCALHGEEFDVVLLGAEPSFVTSGGLRTDGALPLAEAATCDIMVVPGGRGSARAAETAVLVDTVREAGERGAALYAVCSGALVVAAAGIAAGRLAVHRDKRSQLRALTGAEIVQGLVRDPKVVSVGGLATPSVKAVDIAFAVLCDHLPECVRCIADRMEIQPPDATNLYRGDY